MADQGPVEIARAKIVERLRVLGKERESLMTQLEALDAALEVAHHFVDGFNPNVASAVVRRPRSNTAPRSRPRNPSHEAVGDAALRILSDAKKPIARGDLFAAVTEAGLNIQGQDPEIVFSTMMWRQRDRVVNLKGHGYWPADRAYEPAGYEPEERN